MFIQGYEEFLLFHDLPLPWPASVLQAFRLLCIVFYVTKKYEFAASYRIGSCQDDLVTSAAEHHLQHKEAEARYNVASRSGHTIANISATPIPMDTSANR
jgi:hypothetical protein